jgi:hypothetical protein
VRSRSRRHVGRLVDDAAGGGDDGGALALEDAVERLALEPPVEALAVELEDLVEREPAASWMSASISRKGRARACREPRSDRALPRAAHPTSAMTALALARGAEERVGGGAERLGEMREPHERDVAVARLDAREEADRERLSVRRDRGGSSPAPRGAAAPASPRARGASRVHYSASI